jgi:hypothetical protein
MKRRLFPILSALSLLLFVAVCVLWVRSYWVAGDLSLNVVRHPTPDLRVGRAYHIRFSCGEVRLAYWHDRGHPSLIQGKNPLLYWYSRPAEVFWRDERSKLARIGFHSHGNNMALPSGLDVFNRFVTVPAWLPAFLLALLPCAWVTSHVRRNRRLVGGHCPSCGYDLRATPERCPECGAAPTKAGT